MTITHTAQFNGNSEQASHRPDLGPAVSEFGYRKPDVLPAIFVENIEAIHAEFARSFSASLSQLLRIEVEVDQIVTEEMSYRSFVWSLPTPTFMSVISLLRGRAVLEMGPDLVSVLDDRLLGGPGRPAIGRWPTSLDAGIFRRALDLALAALAEAFSPVIAVQPAVETMQFNPRFARVAAPNEGVLATTFTIGLTGLVPFRGTMSLCYPFSTLDPIFDLFRQHTGEEAETTGENDKPERQALEPLLAETTVDLKVRLRPSKAPAAHLSAIQPGDVVILEHWADEPVEAFVENQRLFEGRIGTQGSHVAFEVTDWKESP